MCVDVHGRQKRALGPLEEHQALLTYDHFLRLYFVFGSVYVRLYR